MKLEDQEQQALNQFKKILARKFGPEIISIHLFGSKARGDAHIESDIDVLVTTQHEDWHLKEKIGRVATGILLDHGVYLSVKVVGQLLQQRLISMGSPFIRNVMREGIAL